MPQQQQSRPKRQDSYLQAISGAISGAISPPNNRRAGAPRQASYQKATGNLSPDGSVLDFNQVVNMNTTKKKQTRQSSYQKAIGTMSPEDR